MKKDYLSEMETMLDESLNELRPILNSCDEDDSEDEIILAAGELIGNTLDTVRSWIEREQNGEGWPIQYSDFEIIYNDLTAAEEHLKDYDERLENIYGENNERVKNAGVVLHNAIEMAKTKI